MALCLQGVPVLAVAEPLVSVLQPAAASIAEAGPVEAASSAIEVTGAAPLPVAPAPLPVVAAPLPVAVALQGLLQKRGEGKTILTGRSFKVRSSYRTVHTANMVWLLLMAST